MKNAIQLIKKNCENKHYTRFKMGFFDKINNNMIVNVIKKVLQRGTLKNL